MFQLGLNSIERSLFIKIKHVVIHNCSSINNSYLTQLPVTPVSVNSFSMLKE